MNTRIYNARILTMEEGKPAFLGEVWIEGDTIVYAGSKGKEGAVYEKGYGICFETQYFPDAIHKENFESPITKAGEVYDTTTVYKFC